MAEVQSSANGVLRLPLKGRCGDRRILRGWTLVRNDEFGVALLKRNIFLMTVGYPSVYVGGVDHSFLLHKIVYEHYHGVVTGGKLIDHIDRNKLNNTPENLRTVTWRESNTNRNRNKNNTSGFVGVSWTKHVKKWEAYIWVNRKKYNLGFYEDKIDAAKAVNEAYTKHNPHTTPPNSF